MKRNLLILSISLLLLAMPSCWWSGSEDDTLWVYKTRTDYSENVTVELSKDKTWITNFSGPSEVNPRWPERLADGFYLNGTWGVNSAILSVTKEEYMKRELPFSIDSMFVLMIDKDPILEFYQYNGNEFNIPGGYDTVRINALIQNKQLGKYFDRVK